MPSYRLQIALQDDSGLARDQYVNTLYVSWGSTPTPTNWDSIMAGVKAFYDALNTYFSAGLAQNGHTMKVYQLGAPLDSPPVADYIWNFLNNPINRGLPNECASCLSYHASFQPGVARQSWRGRIYLGPLSTNVLTSPAPVGAHGTVSHQFQDDAIAAAANLATALNAGDGTWVVASKKLHTVYPVATYSMDNEMDTVRSRGLRATLVVSGAVPGGGGSGGSW